MYRVDFFVSSFVLRSFSAFSVGTSSEACPSRENRATGKGLLGRLLAGWLGAGGSPVRVWPNVRTQLIEVGWRSTNLKLDLYSPVYATGHQGTWYLVYLVDVNLLAYPAVSGYIGYTRRSWIALFTVGTAGRCHHLHHACDLFGFDGVLGLPYAVLQLRVFGLRGLQGVLCMYM